MIRENTGLVPWKEKPRRSSVVEIGSGEIVYIRINYRKISVFYRKRVHLLRLVL